jgi:hypothetical protein
MASKKYDILNGPIPGENLISDERNYPWHRPPDFDNLNDSMDFIIETVSEKPKLFAMLNALENEITIAELSQTILMSFMMEGRFTLDFALLLAGPLSKYLSIIAEGYDIEYEMGVEEKYSYYPKDIIDGVSLDAETEEDSVTEDTEEDNEETRVGLMQAMRQDTEGVAPAEEQESMLGYNIEEEEVA